MQGPHNRSTRPAPGEGSGGSNRERVCISRAFEPPGPSPAKRDERDRLRYLRGPPFRPPPRRRGVMSATPTELRTIRFGHSPDADDAYMFYGFHTGEAVIDGCRVEHVLQDIQSLNVRAIERADLEITACSAHAYAHLADRYAVLACGASFGWGYGPVLVAREARDVASLKGRRVAIPGPLTTAALLLRTECPDVVPVEVMFDRIPAAVLTGEIGRASCRERV